MYKKIAVLIMIALICAAPLAWAQYAPQQGAAGEQYFEGTAECAEVNAAQGILILRGQQGQRITIYVTPQTMITNKMTGGAAAINNISPGDMVGVGGMANPQAMTIKAQKIIFLPQFKSGPSTSTPSTQTYPQSTYPQSTYPQSQGAYPSQSQMQMAVGVVKQVTAQGLQIQLTNGSTAAVIASQTTQVAHGSEPMGQMSSLSQIRVSDMVTVMGQVSGTTIQATAILFMHPGEQAHPSWSQQQGGGSYPQQQQYPQQQTYPQQTSPTCP